MKTITLATHSPHRPLLEHPLPLIRLLLVCFALLPRAQATDLDSVLPNGNTADGSGVLVNLTGGVWNSGFGFQALNQDTFGFNNTAMGVRALFSDTTGFNNTAIGVNALYSNTIGDNNTATGFGALFRNTTGGGNTAHGDAALFRNTTGFANTANGEGALFENTIGNGNTATGVHALGSNSVGGENTADGHNTLFSNTTGTHNIALGFNAGANLTTGSNNIHIGNSGVAAEAATIRIGSEFQTRTFIAAIRGVTTGNADAVNVVIDSNGQLGTMSSSRRFKNEIKPMDQTSEAILALKPVTFHYKSDNTGTPQFGLIAEEVAEANPDLVVRDENGEIYTARYDAVNAMLLNEFLKEHRKVEKLEATVAQQQKDFQTFAAEQQSQMQALTARLEQQAAQIQKVSAQLEVNKTAPQIVLNNQ